MITFFEEPLADNWVYPCSLDEIRTTLETLPPDLLEGITTIGLCRSTNRDQYANARYFYGKEARIHIYSWKSDLQLRQPAHTTLHRAKRYFDREIEYGMTLEVSGRRLICRWEKEPLKRFILEHVLLHEIGHHVYYRERIASGLTFQPGTHESEKFAEAYARRCHHRNG